MKTVSNKTLVFLLGTAILLSFIGILTYPKTVNISGLDVGDLGSDAGTASVTVNTTVGLKFTTSTVSFGSGKVNGSAGNQNCTLATNGSGIQNTNDPKKCLSFNNATTPFILENTGNVNVNVTLSSSANASVFINGTNPLFQYFVENNEASSCQNFTGGTGGVTTNPTSFIDVNTTAINICPQLVSTDSSDSLKIHVLIRIPVDAPSGVRSTTFTATGTALS